LAEQTEHRITATNSRPGSPGRRPSYPWACRQLSFAGPQRVMARESHESSEIPPATHPSYQSARCAHATPGVPSLPRSCTACPVSPIPHSGPRRFFRWLARKPNSRGHFPVTRHHRGKRVQLKIKIRVPCRRSSRDQTKLVLFVPRWHSRHFSVRWNHVARVVHPQRHGFFMRPVPRVVVRPKPRPTPGRDNFRRRPPIGHFQTARPALAPVWVYSVWHAKTFRHFFGPCFPSFQGCAPSVRRRSPVKAPYAWLCLSCRIHVEYSF